jgi:putative phosphoribosyl transferase
MTFVDRSDAGRKLALALSSYKGEDVVVLALPRGGVQVAAEVATHLAAPLDLLLVRKIGLPSQPELAMGAVVDGAEPIVVRNDRVIRLARVSAEEFDAACARELAEIDRRRRRYIGSRPPEPVAGRVVIIVDDGIATGATATAAAQVARQLGAARVVVAAPVGGADAADRIGDADEVVCLLQPPGFQAVGSHYRDFRQTSDDEVAALLAAAR